MAVLGVGTPYHVCVPTSTTVRRVPSGDRQTHATLATMREVVAKSLYIPEVVETAVGIVRYVPGRDTVTQQRALRDWLAQRVSFLPDPAINGDVLRTPDYALRQIKQYGIARLDCDDTSMLSAALAKAIGMQARFIVLGFPEYKHVYAEALTTEGWRDFDVTETRARQQLYRPLATRTLTVEA